MKSVALASALALLPLLPGNAAVKTAKRHLHIVKTEVRQITMTDPSAPFGVMLTLDHATYSTAGPTSTLHAALTLFNHSGTTVSYTQHGAPCDWQILDDKGTVLWNYTTGKMMSHLVMVHKLKDSEMTFKQEIALQSQDGTVLPPGNYTLRAALRGERAVSAEVGFTVTAQASGSD